MKAFVVSGLIVVLVAIASIRADPQTACSGAIGLRASTCSQVSRVDLAISRGERWRADDLLQVIVSSAREAAIEPSMLLAVLIRESGDWHLFDWLAGTPAGRVLRVSVGISNVKSTAFDEASAYSKGVINYPWEVIRSDPSRAIEAAAFLLAKRQSELEPWRSRRLTDAEYLRVGYRAGADVMMEVQHSGRYEPGLELFNLAFATAGRILRDAAPLEHVRLGRITILSAGSPAPQVSRTVTVACAGEEGSDGRGYPRDGRRRLSPL